MNERTSSDLFVVWLVIAVVVAVGAVEWWASSGGATP